MNHDVNHLVLERDGRAYDLIDKDDTWGFGNALSWKIDLVGDRLYVFDAHQNWEPGWFQIDVQKNDWLLPRMGFEPDGSIHRIGAPAGVSVPHDSIPGVLFKVENGHLVPVRQLRDYDDLFEHLESGVYYLSPPGLGIRRVIDLERPMVRK